MIRLIALDIDGTLVGDGSEVSHRDREALIEAHRAGCSVALISGRSRGTVLPIYEQFPVGVITALSSYDGAIVELTDPPEVVAVERMGPPMALAAFDALVEAGMGPEIFPGGPGDPVFAWEEAPPPGNWQQHNLWRLGLMDRAGLIEVLRGGPITISAMGPIEEATAGLERVREACGDGVSASLTYSPRYGGYFAQVASPKSTKTHALETIAQRLGVSSPEVMAVGDWLNDIGMLEIAGVGVAMGGSADEVIAAADWVTGPVEAAGVAAAVERYVLGV